MTDRQIRMLCGVLLVFAGVAMVCTGAATLGFHDGRYVGRDELYAAGFFLAFAGSLIFITDYILSFVAPNGSKRPDSGDKQWPDAI